VYPSIANAGIFESLQFFGQKEMNKRGVQAQSLEIGTGHVTDRESLVFLWQQYPPQVLEGSPQEVQRSPQEAEKG